MGVETLLRAAVIVAFLGLAACGDDSPHVTDSGAANIDATGCPSAEDVCRAREANCGEVADTCRHTTVSCGTCTAPSTCGGGGRENVCGCRSTETCESFGATCGTIVDECGVGLFCGGCMLPTVCGGGGTPNQCGCTPTMTCASIGAECGTFVDECGGMHDCGGSCTPPDTCGGGGVPNHCGCTPATSCASLGHNCGAVDGECGVEDCGSCTPLDSCGTTFPGVCAAGLEPGDACLVAEDHCRAGLRCCPGAPFPTCITPAADGSCALPDLTIDESVLRSSITFETLDVAAGDCTIMEGCVDGPGARRLLRFTTQTPNIGTSPLHFGDPSSSSLFVYSSCHEHYHFQQYADYRLLDSAGRVVDSGHKQAFCLMDLLPLPGTTTAPVYDCAFQGISVGWADEYHSSLDCQWIDITGVPAGAYTLEVEINPARVIAEQRYDNNIARVPVTVAP